LSLKIILKIYEKQLKRNNNKKLLNIILLKKKLELKNLEIFFIFLLIKQAPN
jgi:hypothetical protein